MSKPYRDFEPKWYHGEVPPTSYRSIFKWGAPDQIKPPKESLYKLVKEKFGLTDADFDHYTENLGLDAVRFDLPCTMEQRRLDFAFLGKRVIQLGVDTLIDSRDRNQNIGLRNLEVFCKVLERAVKYNC